MDETTQRALKMGDMNYGEELQLPIANIGRIMKKIVPRTAKISKEAKQTMKECATEFISFVTSEAAQKCHHDNRRTLIGDDICWAFGALGLDYYAQAFTNYLFNYREAERIKAQYSKTDRARQQRVDEDEHIHGHVERDGFCFGEMGESSRPI